MSSQLVVSPYLRTLIEVAGSLALKLKYETLLDDWIIDKSAPKCGNAGSQVPPHFSQVWRVVTIVENM